MKKIFIRVDGGKSIGMGHVMRMLTLAEELGKSCEVIFLCKHNDNNEYVAGINKIRESSFQVILISDKDIVSEIMRIQKKMNVDLLITDSYLVDDEYFDQTRKYFKKTAYMDDINIGRINTDIIINQNINALEFKYNTLPNKNTKLLLGPKYILLRDEFRKTGKIKVNSNVKDILLTLGGMDDDYTTLKVINILSRFDGNLHVIIGQAYDDNLINKINQFKSKGLRIITYQNAIMSDVMAKCDLAIAACGSTLYELMAMGLPSIGIVVADNQKRVADVMEYRNIIVNTTRMIYEDMEKFGSIVFEVINNKDIRRMLIEQSSKFVGTDGAVSVAEELMLLIK